MTEKPGYAQPQAPTGDADEPKSPSAPIYTAKVENLGGTAGEVRVEDGQTLSTAPTSRVEEGNNPEQFLAMAWSTCLGETLKVVLAVNEIEALTCASRSLHSEPSGNGFYFAPKAFISIEGLGHRRREVRCPRPRSLPHLKLLIGKGTRSSRSTYKNGQLQLLNRLSRERGPDCHGRGSSVAFAPPMDSAAASAAICAIHGASAERIISDGTTTCAPVGL